MHEPINERVEVIAKYLRTGPYKAMPMRIKWNGREYNMQKIGYYHKYRRGREMIHVFSILAESTYLKLEYNSDTLIWTLVEIYDSESPA